MSRWKPLAGVAAAAWSASAIPLTPPGGSRFTGWRDRLLVGTAAATVTGAGAAVELLLVDTLAVGAVIMIVLMVAAPLVVVLVAPLATWRAMTVGLFASALLVPSATNAWPWPITAFVAYLAVTFLVSTLVDKATLPGLALLGCALPVLPAGPQNRMPDGIIFILFGLVILVVSLGGSLRTTRDTRRALDTEIEHSRAELVRATVLAERSKLARELHDVVAHHMSLVAIQADVIPHAVPGIPREARDAFAAIRRESTTALAEMRRLVDALREPDEGAERHPQPTMDEVGRLVDAVRSAGTTVTLDLQGDGIGVPAAVSVSVYRIVQEALANAVQHAPGARIDTTVRRSPDGITVGVVNAAPRQAPTGDPARAGHGIIGMRERVALLGGSIETGATDDGGFRVRAFLPTSEATR